MVSLDNNPSGQAFLGIQIVFTILAIVFVILRLLARRVTSTSLVFNDYAALVAVAFVIGDCIAGVVSIVPGGAGLDIADVDYPDREIFAKAELAQELTWLIANSAFKLSILHFLLTLFRRKPRFPVFVYILMGIVAVSCTALVLGTFLICQPFSYNWNPAQPGNCNGRGQLFLLSSGFSFLIDVALFILPIPVVWALQMRTARKIAVLGVFGLCAANIAIAGLRIAAIAVLAVSVEAATNATKSSINIGIYSILDTTLGVINACLPIIPPLFVTVTGRSLFGWSHKSSSYQEHKDTSGGRSAIRPASHSVPRGTLTPNGEGVVLPLTENYRSSHDGYNDDQQPRHHHNRGVHALSFDSGIFTPSGFGRTEPRSATFLYDATPPSSRPELANQQPKEHPRSASGLGVASLLESRKASQRQNHSHRRSRQQSRSESRSASRLGNQSASRLGNQSDEDDRELVEARMPAFEGEKSLQNMANASDEGITVTRTWNVGVAGARRLDGNPYAADLEKGS